MFVLQLRFMRMLLLLGALMMLGLAGGAQTRIAGTVADAKGRPVTGASVALKDAYDGATTDSTGSFQFETAEKGAGTLLVTAIGFRPYVQALQLNGELLNLRIGLKEEISELKAVVI